MIRRASAQLFPQALAWNRAHPGAVVRFWSHTRTCLPDFVEVNSAVVVCETTGGFVAWRGDNVALEGVTRAAALGAARVHANTQGWCMVTGCSTLTDADAALLLDTLARGAPAVALNIPSHARGYSTVAQALVKEG